MTRQEEDIAYWNMLYEQSTGRKSSSSAKSTASGSDGSSKSSSSSGSTSAPTPAETTPAGTPVAYDQYGHRIKQAKPTSDKPTQDKDGKKEDGASLAKRGALKIAGTALGGLVAGPLGAAIGNKIADPEWRKNAYRQGKNRPHTAPAPASNQRDIGIFDKADGNDNWLISEAVAKCLTKLRQKKATR